MKRLKGYYQYNQEDCGAACLATILNYYGRKASISILKNKMLYDKNGASVLSIIETAKKYGIESEAYEGTLDELKKEIGEGNFQLPLILHIEKKEIGGHYVVLKKIKNGKIKIFDPYCEISKYSTSSTIHVEYYFYSINRAGGYNYWNYSTVKAEFTIVLVCHCYVGNLYFDFYIRSTIFKEKSKKILFILFRINDRIKSNYKWQISNCNAEQSIVVF